MTSPDTRPAGTGQRRFAAYAWLVVAFNLLVILWGAFVRASKSGDGCGSHWPLCNGEVLPQSPHAGTLIELTHRATSGVALLLVAGLVVWARRAFAKGHPARRGAVLSAVFIVVEALIGAGLVLFRLVGEDASVARAAYLSVHLVNTFILVAVLALTAWYARGGPQVRWGGGGRLRRSFAAALAGTLALGVSGAVAALGATLFPEAEVAARAARQDLTPAAQLLFGLRHYKLHPALAAAVGCYLVGLAVAVRRLRPDAWVRRWSSAVVALVLLELGAGVLNVMLLAPVWLQLTHLLLADLLWLALVLLAASALAQPEAEAAEFGRAGLRPAVEV